MGEYKHIFELATQFKGELSSKLASLRVSEKISKAAFENSVTDPTSGDKTLPTSITVEFEKNELEGYWKGIVGYLSEPDTSLEKILVVKAICKSMGMSGRFAKLSASLSTIPEDETPLDD